MKATFKGYISLEQNAIFEKPAKMIGDRVVFWNHYELKDGIDADQFVIGEEYDISEITK